jgi:hypothetical protein
VRGHLVGVAVRVGVPEHHRVVGGAAETGLDVDRYVDHGAVGSGPLRFCVTWHTNLFDWRMAAPQRTSPTGVLVELTTVSRGWCL